TIAKLRAAGFEHLADLRGRPVEVEGLGPKRLGDVQQAVRDLDKQARSRFDAGACPEARQLAGQLARLWAERREAGARALARRDAAAAVVQELQRWADVARHIDFSWHVQRLHQQAPPLPPLPAEL